MNDRVICSSSALLLVIGLIALCAAPAHAKDSAAPGVCDAPTLQAALSHTEIILSALNVSGTPSYCQVKGRITTSGNGAEYLFQVDLPDPGSWNSRLLVTGNGGFGGGLGIDTVHLQEGYTVAATNTGHRSTTGEDATWALHNPTAVKDFDYLAIHQTLEIAQDLVNAYYVTASTSYFSYFDGCSTGGRQGLVEAQKYPNDFNGIVAGDPAIGNAFLAYNWDEQAVLQDTTTYIDQNALALLDHAVLTECDGLDGVVDGLIQNPSICKFDVTTLACAPGQTTGCLSSEQIATIQQIYQGPVDTKGNSLYPGLSPSDPAESVTGDSAWGQYLTGCADPTIPCKLPDFGSAEPWAAYFGAPVLFTRQDSYMKYFVANDANYDSLTFSFLDQKSINKVAKVIKKYGADGTTANIKSFVSKGHKLLMYHGWSDPAFSPFVSVNYFNSVQQILGSGRATTDSVRLFMVPGMHHCQGFGPGPNTFDELTPLTTWVEQGVAPDGIIASHYINDDSAMPIDRTMPLCSYPEEAQYNGIGPVNTASSWSCPEPGASTAR